MAHQHLVFIALVAATLQASSALILDCTYSEWDYWHVNGYACKGKVVFVNDPLTVIEVSGIHFTNRNHSDVLQVSIKDANVKFIPRHLGAFFPNLESIDMTDAVESVSKLDFAGLPNLKQLHFNDNKVKRLENDLFIGNPKMKWISFINNPITNVGYNVFENLADLTSLRFDRVTCHNGPSSDDPIVARDTINKIFVYCPPTLEMIFAKIKEKILKEADRMDQGRAVQLNIMKEDSKLEKERENESFELKRMLNNHDNRIIKLENNEKLGFRNLFD